MSDKYILDERGEPKAADLMTWANWFEGNPSRHLAKDERGDVKVSTVFLSIDHNWGDGPPVLWETMIFGGKHDQYQERYTSRAAALEGHALACSLAFAAEPPALG